MPPKPRTTSPTPARQLSSFIAKFDPSVAKVLRACRAALRKRFPTAVELVYDNYNFFVIGYCSTPKASDCIVSLTGSSNGVGLCFTHGAKLPDPKGWLLGSGRQTRFIRLPSASVLKAPAVETLLKVAIARARTPLPSSGNGATVIKSISAKQRPRRAAFAKASAPKAASAKASARKRAARG
ncbi:MAG TPA: hypothetical protein VMZ90_11930 [Vicinamibacterales bacterium]|nr:hypothetical protein [Vicinamibacterales bacterium]